MVAAVEPRWVLGMVTAVLVALLTVATATDLRRRKIYNWTTYPGILAALGLNALGSTLERWRLADEQMLASWGLAPRR